MANFSYTCEDLVYSEIKRSRYREISLQFDSYPNINYTKEPSQFSNQLNASPTPPSATSSARSCNISTTTLSYLPPAFTNLSFSFPFLSFPFLPSPPFSTFSPQSKSRILIPSYPFILALLCLTEVYIPTYDSETWIEYGHGSKFLIFLGGIKMFKEKYVIWRSADLRGSFVSFSLGARPLS